MPRFLLFYGENYYPNGGWSDFQGAYDTLEIAKSMLIEAHFDWAHIVDTAEGTIHRFRR